MDVLSATEVRKNWSLTLDSVVRERPAYIKRTHDEISIMDIRTLNYLLGVYHFEANKFLEQDGSVTLSMTNMDLIVNGKDLESAKDQLVIEIINYANEYYDEYALWSAAPNRRSHIPYVLKALTLDAQTIREDIVCLDGKN